MVRLFGTQPGEHGGGVMKLRNFSVTAFYIMMVYFIFSYRIAKFLLFDLVAETASY